ncbi:DJ-1/PfpI family protein [Polycladidibacter stylochi]|uniref:DJ-1/PfpI family protein n=1 Tax=Polycladidibacter stylochi TaxID=1807766 RepID=UPI000834C6EC|nr:DJ-1/PfpI family protein [Pseudovibrio stylochi]
MTKIYNTTTPQNESSIKTISILIFPDFEVLDVFGPMELFGMLPDNFLIELVAQTKEPVRAKQGALIIPDKTIYEVSTTDILLVPGGRGTRTECENKKLLLWLVKLSRQAELVLSVCTGAALLANAGLLDGKQATTNKMAFKWVSSLSDKVNWKAKARWVEDDKIFSSSGVSAGMDMSLAVIEKLLGQETAEDVASFAEYYWNNDAESDKFSEIYGLN